MTVTFVEVDPPKRRCGIQVKARLAAAVAGAIAGLHRR